MGDCLGTTESAAVDPDIDADKRPLVVFQYQCPSQVERLQAGQPTPVASFFEQHRSRTLIW